MTRPLARRVFVRSQDLSDYAGKVIRLRDDGTGPADNPFIGRAGFKPAIYTLGHRKPLVYSGAVLRLEPVGATTTR